jgi:starch synthase (maltosyl-transferring)
LCVRTGKSGQNVPVPTATQAPTRIVIEHPAPTVDCGRYPIKRTVGDVVHVSADIFRDGHDVLRAVVRWRGPGDEAWQESPLVAVDAHYRGVRWEGAFTVDRPGTWEWTIEAWVDSFATWRDEVARKLEAAQQSLAGEASEGAVLLGDAAAGANGADRAALEQTAESLRDGGSVEEALEPAIAELVDRHARRSEATRLAEPLEVDVDRVLARFGSWYELFPRSFGGFRGVQQQLPRLAELGFDVLYLPPIHPIGHTNRKGRNNTLVAGPDDPGSPWAIGDERGGHDAIHPDLGSFEDFDALVAAAKEHGIEIALDFAIQCSADHPWLTEHPEWFNHRPDGTLKYAENPPKKYQDIYNVNWDTDAWRELWEALLGVVRHWVQRGVRVFRVDNPHTKPLAFWEWLIAEVRGEDPEVIFLSEAFTRLPMMRALGKVGFSQSYTYFTWKNGAWELREYVDELLSMADVLRPNLFVNTPDILTEYLQHGGPPAFHARLVLAATLGPSYGVYSGFEHYEHEAVRPGSEEYLDSEKYEVRERRLDGPLLPMIGDLNLLRREHPALQRLEGVWFLHTENEALLAYAKRAPGDVVLVVVNVDPASWQEGVCVIPYELGLPPAFHVADALTGEAFDWRVGRNFVRLAPGGAHVLTLA